ncbi:hypothetical protein HOF26_02290 [bacterium]|nr:hypothetical protein [bacterium]
MNSTIIFSILLLFTTTAQSIPGQNNNLISYKAFIKRELDRQTEVPTISDRLCKAVQAVVINLCNPKHHPKKLPKVIWYKNSQYRVFTKLKNNIPDIFIEKYNLGNSGSYKRSKQVSISLNLLIKKRMLKKVVHTFLEQPLHRNINVVEWADKHPEWLYFR